MHTFTSQKFHIQLKETIRVRITLLGKFRIWVDSHLVPDQAWKRRKVQTLIKLLALTSRHCLHREQLMELLWPEAEIESARNNLRQTLHLARKILQNETNTSAGILIDHNGWLCLTHEEETWVDTEAFETAAKDCRESEDETACQTALTLYKGELLPEDRYEDWVALRREALCWLYLSTLSKLGKILEDQGDFERAIDIYQRVVAADPTAEHAHRSLMRLYTIIGFRNKALQQYYRMQEFLDQELALEPDPDSIKLYEDILSGNFQMEITQK